MSQSIKNKINKHKLLILCLILFAGYSIQAQNLALSATATQSSTLSTASVSNAIDGKLPTIKHMCNTSTTESNLNYISNTLFNS